MDLKKQIVSSCAEIVQIKKKVISCKSSSFQTTQPQGLQCYPTYHEKA